MDVTYYLTDENESVTHVLTCWNNAIAQPHETKYVVTFDITRTHKFNIKHIIQMTGFIARRKRVIKEQTEKIVIILRSKEQERMIKTGLSIIPSFVPFEIIRQNISLN